MPKKSRNAISEEREVLLELLRISAVPQYQSDLSSAYEQRTGRRIPYMTLRARLDELVSRGMIARDQRRRLPRFWMVPTPDGPPDARSDLAPRTPTRPAGGETEPAPAIALAPDAKQARAILALHPAHRQPSTYDFGFLDNYTPNVTEYLPSRLRSRLAELGRTAAAGQPAGTYARDIMQRLVIDLSWGSSRLEGNKYSRIDTEELIRAGRDAEGATDIDRQMILNHKTAIEFLVDNADAIGFNRYTIQSLHAMLSENLLDDRNLEGQLRLKAVTIGTSLYTPTAIPQVIESRFDALLAKAEAIIDPIEQAFFVMVHLPYLQPFIDVNKRTSRLAANIPLIRANLCPLSFVDVPEELYTQGTLAVYELRDVALLRDVFVWAYERSCRQFKVLREAMGDPDPIRLNYRTELRELIRTLVRGGEWLEERALLARASDLNIPEKDCAAFAHHAYLDLSGLKLELIARYGLRPSEFAAWLEKAASNRDPDAAGGG